jgi:hypothetical protein
MGPKSLAPVVMGRPRAEPGPDDGEAFAAVEVGSGAVSDAVLDVVDSRGAVLSRVLGSPLQPATTSPAAAMVAAMVRRREFCGMSFERFGEQPRALVDAARGWFAGVSHDE